MMSEVAAADLGKMILKSTKVFVSVMTVFSSNRQMQKANKRKRLSWISTRHSRDLVMMNAHASRLAFMWKNFSLFLRFRDIQLRVHFHRGHHHNGNNVWNYRHKFRFPRGRMRFAAHDDAQRRFVEHFVYRNHRQFARLGISGWQKGQKSRNRLHTDSVVCRQLFFEPLDEPWNARGVQICVWIFVSGLGQYCVGGPNI